MCERSTLQRADGSARWRQDGTVVLGAVHGPRQAPAAKEDAERAVIEVVFKPRSGLAGAQLGAFGALLARLLRNPPPITPVHRGPPAGHHERELEHIIRRTLEGVVPLGLFPRTSIQVVLQVRACSMERMGTHRVGRSHFSSLNNWATLYVLMGPRA